MKMKIDNGLRRALEEDLGINAPFVKGQVIAVRNCWHFSTDGNLVDFLFKDEEDFIAGMNRIYVLSRKYRIAILAFVLMDTHVHFIIWGDIRECEKFVHEYLRLTSMYLARKYGDRHKLEHLLPDYQVIDNDRYLKTAICYVLKNPPVGGIAFNALEYPWSSAPLYFKRKGYWSSYNFDSVVTYSDSLNFMEIRDFLKCRIVPEEKFRFIGRIVFPEEYVAVETVERLFKTHKGFNFFMCISKESDVESVGGSISRLSIPNSELHQHKQELCKARFGTDSIRKLSTDQRLSIAKTLRAQYNCSPKQTAKVCGLIYDEVKAML